MKISAEQHLHLTQQETFRKVADVDALFAATRGFDIKLRREDPAAPVGSGTKWQGSLDLRGVQRDLVVEVTDYRPSDKILLQGHSAGLVVDLHVSVEPSKEAETRLSVQAEVSGRGITGKVLVQSLRLMHGQLQDRLDRGLASYARRIEHRTGPAVIRSGGDRPDRFREPSAST